MLDFKEITDDLSFPPVEVFFSRRNKVKLKNVTVNGQDLFVVLKEYVNEINASQEAEFLTKLHAKQVKVPLCLGQYENIVYTEYLSGVLLNMLVDNVPEYGYHWIAKLAKWYYDFHNAFSNDVGQVLLRKDNNLRNFVYHDDQIYGLDFEQLVYGYPEQDLGECGAYILTNTPAFTEEKFFIINELSREYYKLNHGANVDKLKPEIISYLHTLGQYRPKQKDEILSNIYKLK